MNINFKIATIEIISQSVSSAPEEGIRTNEIDYTIQINIKYDANIGMVHILPEISLTSKIDKSELAKFAIQCSYEVINYNEAIPINESNQPAIPVPFLHTLISISLSTSRGIIYSSCRGTFLQNAILPIIDPKSFFPGS